MGPFGYLEPEILELELKTLKISENSKYIRKTAKIPENIQKFTLKQIENPKDIRIIFCGNINFYMKPEIIPENMNPKLKKDSKIPKIYLIIQIYIIYTIIFGYFGYSI